MTSEDSEADETPADRIAHELGEAAGRAVAIMDVEEYIEEQGLTELEQFELACSILDDLNYVAPREWPTEPSRIQDEEEEADV